MAKAKLFDGSEITFSGEDIESMEFERDDYSILITFKAHYQKQTGYTTERAELISI